MKQSRRILFLLCAAVFLVSCTMLLRQTFDYRGGAAVYDEAAALAALPELIPADAEELTDLEEEAVPLAALPTELAPAAAEESDESAEATLWVDPYADALAAMDFAALQEVNEDVFGWIVIPGTRLSYPLLQGEDNDYYLERTWRKGRNSVGAIFMDYRVSRDLNDFHSVIYGHRMNDRSMFGILLNYKNQEYFEANPTVYIADENGSHAYSIFAAYEADAMATYMLDADFENDAERRAFLEYCCGKSVIETNTVPTIDDHILTLSTCTGRGHDTRWVVQAVRTE